MILKIGSEKDIERWNDNMIFSILTSLATCITWMLKKRYHNGSCHRIFRSMRDYRLDVIEVLDVKWRHIFVVYLSLMIQRVLYLMGLIEWFSRILKCSVSLYISIMQMFSATFHSIWRYLWTILYRHFTFSLINTVSCFYSLVF